MNEQLNTLGKILKQAENLTFDKVYHKSEIRKYDRNNVNMYFYQEF